MKKSLVSAIIVAAAATVLTLAGCSTSGNDTAADQAQTSAATKPTAEPTPTPPPSSPPEVHEAEDAVWAIWFSQSSDYQQTVCDDVADFDDLRVGASAYMSIWYSDRDLLDPDGLIDWDERWEMVLALAELLEEVC